jgi:repressor LexA
MSPTYGLTARQRELLAYLDEREFCPSFREMREAIGVPHVSVFRLLNQLEERGYIRRLSNRARAIEVLKSPRIPTVIINGEQYRFIPVNRKAA